MHPPPPRVRTVLKKKEKNALVRRGRTDKSGGRHEGCSSGEREPKGQRHARNGFCNPRSRTCRLRGNKLERACHETRRQPRIYFHTLGADRSLCTAACAVKMQALDVRKAHLRARSCKYASGPCQEPFFDAGFTGVYAGQPGPSVEAAG